MQEGTNNQQLQVFEHLSKGNKFVFYIYRKITRISGAIYLITDLIKDVEPLKWQMRKTAAEMMSLRNFFDQKAVFNTLEEYLLELESTLELGKISKVVSEMNVMVVQGELQKLLAEMRDRSKEGFYAPELVSSFFEVDKPAPLSFDNFFSKENGQDREYHKGHKGHDVRYDFYNNKSDQNRVPKRPLPTGVGSDSKGHRKDEILKIIKIKGSVTIKDITDLIHDCSEKTIQRELLGLVEDGSVKRTGERRWSRYTLN